MSEIRSQCEGCGACCRAIYVPLTHAEFEREKAKENATKWESDLSFVIQYWEPISKEEALQRNPHLQTWYDELMGLGHDPDKRYNDHFYKCNNLDESTGRCKVHETRPDVCKGYPWYGREPHDNHSWYADDCFYKRDVQDVQTAENMQNSIHA